MKWYVIFLMVTMAYSPVINAGKVYKIVDSDGNVTYSQFPPRAEERAGKAVEDIKLDNSDEPKTRITSKFGDQYCGDIKLPSQARYSKSSTKYYTKNIMRSEERWQESLDSLNKRMERDRLNKIKSNKNKKYYSSSYQSKRDSSFNDRYQRDTQRVLDLRCAVDWAKEKRKKIDAYEVGDASERTRLNAIYKKLEADLASACGSQPLFDPTDERNDLLRKRWYTCSKGYISDMKKIQKRLDRL